MRGLGVAACFLILLPYGSAFAGEFPEVDELTTICVETSHRGLCEATREAFKDDWVAAQQGDYQAQRNIAFCLSTGCDGAVVVDRVEGCAWRMIIQASGARQEPTERESFRNACDLGASGRRDSLARAETMFKSIYRKRMPLERLLN